MKKQDHQRKKLATLNNKVDGVQKILTHKNLSIVKCLQIQNDTRAGARVQL